MMHPLPDELSEYLDGGLPAERAARVERHLGDCAECAALLDELRRVIARAQALDDQPPRRDLWPGVAAAIGAGPRHRRAVAVPIPLLLAAGLALMVLSGGSVLLWTRSQPAAAAAPAATAPVPTLEAGTAGAGIDRGYAGAVRALESELERGRGRLDTLTVRVLEEKLALIDRAIGEAERALATDPGNGYLAGHLTQTRLRKLDLLRRAAALSRAVS